MSFATDKVEVRDVQMPEKGQMSLSLGDILADITALKNLLQVEISLIRQAKIFEAGKLFDEKLRLIRKLEIIREIMTKKPELVSDKTPEHIAVFSKLSGDLAEVIKQNFIEVMKAREINKRVVEAVAKALARHENNASVYNKRGAVYNGSIGIPSGFAAKSGALAINRVI